MIKCIFVKSENIKLMNPDQTNDIVEITEDFINIEAVFKKKNPRLLKMIPGFIIRYLKRIIHQKELNQLLYSNRHLEGLDFIKAILDYFRISIEVRGLENFKSDGRYIIASNHPLGGMDGMALMNEVGKMRKDIVFPVNDILLFLPPLRPLFIPINKHGSNNENVKIINHTFLSGTAILYFPAGLVSRKKKGVIEDIPWKKTFISKSRQYQRDIIPVHITGHLSNFFYNLANLRGFLGIKSNIEMLYLVNEMFKQKGRSITITFGKSIPYETFDKRYNDVEWASKVRRFIYQMHESNDPNLNF